MSDGETRNMDTCKDLAQKYKKDIGFIGFELGGSYLKAIFDHSFRINKVEQLPSLIFNEVAKHL